MNRHPMETQQPQEGTIQTVPVTLRTMATVIRAAVIMMLPNRRHPPLRGKWVKAKTKGLKAKSLKLDGATLRKEKNDKEDKEYAAFKAKRGHKAIPGCRDTFPAFAEPL